MKKASKKLVLSKETLRSLGEAEMNKAAGNGLRDSVSGCAGHCESYPILCTA